MNVELKRVESDGDWERYHHIRKTVLFPDRPYDTNHPDEYSPENVPLLLVIDDEAVATVRLDIRKDHSAVVRLVAVAKGMQSQGIGKILYQQLLAFGAQYKLKKLLVNSAPDATGYYLKLGFREDVWDESELQGIAEDCIQMSCLL